MSILVKSLALAISLSVAFAASSRSGEIKATTTNNFFEVRKCELDKIAPGTIVFQPHESNLIFHISRCRLKHISVLGGRANVIRPHGDGRIVGIERGRPFDIDSSGNDVFSEDVKNKIIETIGRIHHDIMRRKKGTYIAIGRAFYYPWSAEFGKRRRRVDNPTVLDRVKLFARFGTGKMVSDDIIVEFDTSGKILWRWSVNKNLLGSRTGAIELSRYKENWMHTNSVDEFPNGDLLISARNINQVVRVSYPDGKILWRWGEKQLGLQHHATVQNDSSVLIYDNGDHRKITGWVRISAQGKFMQRGDFDFFAEYFGSVQQLPNGNWLTVDGPKGRIIEFSPDRKRKLAEFKLLINAYITWESKFRSYIYRAYHVP